MRRVRRGAALVVVVLVVACVACAERPESARPGSSAAMATTAFGGTDTAWTQLMIAMTAQAATLLEVTATRAAGGELAGLATRLDAEYRGELRLLRTALTGAGLTPTNVHDGHELPGMITPADLEVIGQRTGPDFDALVVAHLREEMEQSVRLARSEQRTGQNDDCKAIAVSIDKARTTSLKHLNAVIGS
jgi:uncharacterized protein (DUF305 family)